jgi:hypothetical protein
LRIVLILATAAVLTAGCGGPSFPETYPVTGVVTLNGKPLEGADVQLVPAGNDPKARSAGGTTDAEGKFSVKTYFDAEHHAEGAVTGEYVITLSKLEKSEMPEGMEPTKAMAQMMKDGPPKNLVPKKYQVPTTSGFKVSVGKAPPEPLKLELQGKGG